ELPVGKTTVTKGELLTDLDAYQLRTFAIKLETRRARLPLHSQTVALPYDLSVTSNDGAKSSPGFDSAGRALPAEMLPRGLEYDGIRFQFGPATKGTANAALAKGQTITLPRGVFNRVYLVAASSDGDQTGTF